MLNLKVFLKSFIKIAKILITTNFNRKRYKNIIIKLTILF